MPDGPSRFAYVTNSPLMYVDPTGLNSKPKYWNPLGPIFGPITPGSPQNKQFVKACLDGLGWLGSFLNNDDKSGDKDGADAPGKPTEKDGFKPKKTWDGKKVKNPNKRGGYGYPDKDVKVWVPTGPNGHGGAHWDVQYPKGGYHNQYPGGRRR